jgi:transglutaminase-like putative cysteine protease
MDRGRVSGMRISVVHSTSYRYSNPVHLEPHVIHLRPRDDGSQRLTAFALDVTPRPAGRSDALDQDGNVATHVWFEGLTEEFCVRTSFQIETLRDNPFDYLLQDSDRDVPVQYAESLRSPLIPYLRADHDPSVHELARQVAVEVNWQTTAFLGNLSRRLFESLRQINRPNGAPYPPARTLAEGAGSCRDLAVLFCAACRAMGIAARFVSGYERDAAFGDQGDLHAWGEVYLQGGGWRGYDPSRGLAVGASHVPVAAAADSSLVVPVSGTYRGAAESTMDFSIAMQVW